MMEKSREQIRYGAVVLCESETSLFYLNYCQSVSRAHCLLDAALRFLVKRFTGIIMTCVLFVERENNLTDKVV